MDKFIDYCAYAFVFFMLIIFGTVAVMIYYDIQNIEDEMHSIQIMILEKDHQ